MEANHCDEIEILISVMVFYYNKTVPHYKNYFTNFSLIVLSLKLILPEDYYEFLSEIMFLHVYSQHFCCIQSNGKLFFHHLYTHIGNEHTENYSIRETLRAITRYLSSADTHLPLSPTDYTYPPPIDRKSTVFRTTFYTHSLKWAQKYPHIFATVHPFICFFSIYRHCTTIAHSYFYPPPQNPTSRPVSDLYCNNFCFKY